MDEKVLEEIRFHQDVVNKDANSPLYQIREKEMEISGRVLAAKTQAEKIVTDARKAAAETLRTAETDADKAAKKHAETAVAKAEVEASELRGKITVDTDALEKELGKRHSEAVDAIVSIVTSV
jgi:vacuolar-type H+-ATPase subunit H